MSEKKRQASVKKSDTPKTTVSKTAMGVASPQILMTPGPKKKHTEEAIVSELSPMLYADNKYSKSLAVKDYIDDLVSNCKIPPEELVPDIHADDAKTVHEALKYQSTDKDIIGGVDSSIKVENLAFDKTDFTIMEDGYKLNERYVLEAAKLKAEFPFAQVVAKRSAPISRIQRRIKEIRTGYAQHGRSRVIANHRAKTRERAAKIFGRARTLKAIADDDFISTEQQGKRVQDQMVNELSENLGIATLLSSANMPRKEFEKEIRQYYYLPKNCTVKAMKALVADAVMYANEPESTAARYHLPSREAMNEICLHGMFGSLEELESAIEIGTMLKTMKAINSRSKSDATFERSQAPFEINDYYIDKDTTLAARYLEEYDGYDNVDLDGDYIGDYQIPETEEDKFFEREVERGLEDLKELYESEGDVPYIRPFIHSLSYTYKILFQVYLNRHGFKLPFGRTIPSLPWVYIFSYYLDPENVLNLRMSKDRYLLSVGGIGLLERDIIKDMPVDQHVYKLFKPTMSNNGDLTVFKNAVVSVYTLLIKMKSCIDHLSELKDVKDDLQNSISNSVERMQNITNSVGIAKDHDVSGILEGAIRTADKIFDPSTTEEDLERLIFEMHQVEYNPDRARLTDATAPLSYDSAFMASMMAKFALDWESGSDLAKCWFVKGVLNKGKDQNVFFDLLSGMMLSSDFQGMTVLLFGSKETANKATSYLKKAQEIVRTAGEELASIVCSDTFSQKAELSWLNTFSSQAIKQNQTISSLVKTGLDQKLSDEARMELDDSAVILDTSVVEDFNLSKRLNIDDQLEAEATQVWTLSEIDSMTALQFAKHVLKIDDLNSYKDALMKVLNSMKPVKRREYKLTLLNRVIDYLSSASRELSSNDEFIDICRNKSENMPRLLDKPKNLKSLFRTFKVILKGELELDRAIRPQILICRRMINILIHVCNL